MQAKKSSRTFCRWIALVAMLGCGGGIRIAAPECRIDADCSEGLVCQLGSCQEANQGLPEAFRTPRCSRDADCIGDYICVQAQGGTAATCQLGCRIGEPCGAPGSGYSCIGEHSQEAGAVGVCQLVCEVDDEDACGGAGSSYVCAQKPGAPYASCQLGCSADTDCPLGYVCAADSLCQPGCYVDDDCPDAHHRCSGSPRNLGACQPFECLVSSRVPAFQCRGAGQSCVGLLEQTADAPGFCRAICYNGVLRNDIDTSCPVDSQDCRDLDGDRVLRVRSDNNDGVYICHSLP